MQNQRKLQLEIRIAESLQSNIREVAKKEIQGFFPIVETTISQLQLKLLEKVRVWITDDMDRVVQRVQREYGLEVQKPFTSSRTSGEVGGKAISSHGGKEVSVVLSSKFWTSEEPKDRFYRYYLLIHEFIHVAMDTAKLKKGEERSGSSPSFQQYAESIAEICWKEYKTEYLTDSLLRETHLFSDETKSPVGLLAVIGPGWLGQIQDLLEHLCQLVRNPINRFLETGEGFDRILEEVSPVVEELFTTLGHLIGASQNASDTDQTRLVSKLRDLKGFTVFIAEDWDELVISLQSKELEQIQMILSNVLSRLGLEVQGDSDDSFYLAVNNPRFC